MSFNVEIPEINAFIAKYASAPEKAHKKMSEAIKAGTIVMQSLAMSQAPVRTGKMRSAIKMEAADLEGRVSPDLKLTPYAMYVHEGTGLYGKNKRPIVPKTKSVLATKINPGWGTANKSGYYIIGKSSKGQHPNPFMKRAYDMGKTRVSYVFRLAIKEFEAEMKI